MPKLSRKEMLQGNIRRNLVRISIPLVFLSLINTLYGIVDTYFVGKIGEFEVGAISLISPITSCATAFCDGLCAASMALISMAIGADDEVKAKQLATHILKMCMLLAVVLCAGMLMFRNQIMIWLKAPEDILESALTYFIGISFDFAGLFGLALYQSIMQAHGDSRSGVVLNTLAAVINCILDPLFILGFRWSLLGAALATVLSKLLLLPIAYWRLKKNFMLAPLHKGFCLDLTKEVIRVALPCSLGNFLSNFGFVLMTKEIAAYGSMAISAYGIGGKISNLYYLFVNCWGSALTTLVGASLGAKDYQRCRQSYRQATLMVGIISLIFIPLGLLTGRFMIHLLMPSITSELMEMSLEYAYYSIFTAFCMGWMNNLTGVFNGSGNTLISMILTGSRIWVIRIPLIHLLNRLTTLGVANIWIAMCLSNLIVCLMGCIFYHIYPWDRQVMRFRKNPKTC